MVRVQVVVPRPVMVNIPIRRVIRQVAVVQGARRMVVAILLLILVRVIRGTLCQEAVRLVLVLVLHLVHLSQTAAVHHQVQNHVRVHAVLQMVHVHTVGQHVRIQIHVMVIIPVRVVHRRAHRVRDVRRGRVQLLVHVLGEQSVLHVTQGTVYQMVPVSRTVIPVRRENI